MPLSFATLLGGMLTLIGTPPNLLISQFRAQALGERFGMFDFTPVGLALALAGVAFVVTIGWRLIPKDRRGKAAEQESFEVTDYSTERSEEHTSELQYLMRISYAVFCL